MIAKLAGVLDSVAEASCIVDVGGVGYLVFCSARTLRALPRPGEAVRLVIETHVREDHIHLYGFLTEAERQWFGQLQTVQGIGARIALALLSTWSPAELAQAIAASDKAALTQADGVGAKLAVRMITELKDKVGMAALGAGAALGGNGAPSAVSAETADAVSALVHLGYRPNEAYGAIAKAARALGPAAKLQALIRAGLKELAQ